MYYTKELFISWMKETSTTILFNFIRCVTSTIGLVKDMSLNISLCPIIMSCITDHQVHFRSNNPQITEDNDSTDSSDISISSQSPRFSTCLRRFKLCTWSQDWSKDEFMVLMEETVSAYIDALMIA